MQKKKEVQETESPVKINNNSFTKAKIAELQKELKDMEREQLKETLMDDLPDTLESFEERLEGVENAVNALNKYVKLFHKKLESVDERTNFLEKTKK